MERASNAAEIFLIPLDPPRGLQGIAEDLERLTELDPKLKAAVDLLGGRFESYTGEARETILAILWAHTRPRMQQGWLAGFRSWLDDGGSVLVSVERALDSMFSKAVLDELLQHGTVLTASDSAMSAELRQALDEVRQVLSTDLIPIFFLAGYGLGALYDDLTAPPPPPPPPPHHLEAEHHHH
jgi:hypothetical protein